MADLPDPADLPADARLRSGTAARLAGVPVSTLRVWERRYAVVAAPKTTTGQRVYTPHDVQRLRLLKRLTENGHAIGTIATLPLAALQGLLTGTPAEGPAGRAVETSLVVIGRGLARKLDGAPGVAVQALFDDLDEAEAQAGAAALVDVLLVHLPSLQPASAGRVLALAARASVGRVVLLYTFGAEAVAESLRSAGATVRRDPVTGRELARMLAAKPRLQPAPGLPSAPRRYSDEALAQLAELPSSVACECPRHLAEIVMQLAAFECYSADCLARSPADAALHRDLSGLAGTARTLFEQALERVAAAEGLELAPLAGTTPRP